MPAFIRDALREKNVRDAYAARPPYQWNDAIGWITRRSFPPRRSGGCQQMLDELERGTGT